MTVRDVADYLKCSLSTGYRLAHAGRLPRFRLGGAWRFRRTDIDAWIEQLEVVPGNLEQLAQPPKKK